MQVSLLQAPTATTVSSKLVVPATSQQISLLFQVPPAEEVTLVAFVIVRGVQTAWGLQIWNETGLAGQVICGDGISLTVTSTIQVSSAQSP